MLLHIATVCLTLGQGAIRILEGDINRIPSITRLGSCGIHHVVLVLIKTVFDGLIPLVSLSSHSSLLVLRRVWKGKILFLNIVDLS